MVGVFMSLLGIAAGVGLYFIIPIGAVLLVVGALPLIGIHLLNRFARTAKTERMLRSRNRWDIVVEEDEPTVASFKPAEPEHEELEHVRRHELPALLDKLPDHGWHDEHFEQRNGRWLFSFRFNSERAQFLGDGIGRTPLEAFHVAKEIVEIQIRQWHDVRFQSDKFVGRPTKPLLSNWMPAPNVLIVDDDIDLAMAMEAGLGQLGFNTEVVTHWDDLHRKISFGHADLIVLDWVLNDQVTADKVVEKAIRLIGAFPDLRERFSVSRPRVVTYSALDRNHVHLPQSEYFDHLDHWQKPVPYSEVIKRISSLLATPA